MNFNKNVQYGLMLCFYLSRSGRSNLQIVSENLHLSVHFLEQIARKLRIAGVITSIRGPGGGYELKSNSTIDDVFNAIEPIQLIKSSEIRGLLTGEIEKRALANYAKSFRNVMRLTLKRKIKDVCNETQANEAGMFKSLDISTGGH